MKLTITKTHKEEREIEIPVPSFWREPVSAYTCVRGLVNDHTLYEVLELNDATFLESRDAKNDNGKISDAYERWTPITEEEFMSIYKTARFKTDLTPQILSEKMDAELNHA